MNKKGIALVIGFLVIVVLAVLGSAMVSSSISESRVAQRYLENTQAFWLAEAGANQALNDLRTNYNLGLIASTQMGAGGYSVTITPSGQQRIVRATGFIPFTGTTRASRTIQVVMEKIIPTDFYKNAIYSGGVVDFNGENYSVVNNEAPPDNKAVIYADAANSKIEHPEKITGTLTPDSSISPLARLDFQQLLTISSAQQNVYITQNNKLVNRDTGVETFPNSFWYAAGVPNVIYIEGDLKLKGNVGTVGGFFVVVGDVITAPSVTQEAEIDGNGMVEGCIYTRGEFRINGGGGNLNVNGGVWAGTKARLNGSASVMYNKTYMDAIRALNINTSVQVISWQDTQNPYSLTP